MHPKNPHADKRNGANPDLMLDDAHLKMPLCPPNSMSYDIWRDKYRWGEEASLEETCRRVADGIYVNDMDHGQEAFYAMEAGLWIPAGRILAGAGTPKRVTLMNCYVNQVIGDNMESIMQGNTNAALTMQQGGGIGTDFSTIRPEGAILKRTHTKASGPIPFMKMWDGMSSTIRSAGDRRGAMMGTLSDTHPDLLEFVKVKQTSGQLTNFNISILVSDAFMEAVREDEDWLLHFSEPPFKRTPETEALDFVDEDTNVKQYVYSVHRARDIWEKITKATFTYSEPGVIFIDRINDLNNLHYCEDIRCTNPCGEQPLPPHGTCNLGAVNLARMVRHPFTSRATFNWALLRYCVAIGTRFLDNVIDVTGYPLPEQEAEEKAKRRLGLGITGLADALAQLGLRYGSAPSADFAANVMETICNEAYATSIQLSTERGSFPLFDAEKFLTPNTFASQRLHHSVHEQIRHNGLRNALLLTNAPTGTTSVAFGDMSSSLEPVFAHKVKRRVRQEKDTEWKEYISVGYGARLFFMLHGDNAELPAHMVTTADLKVEEHVLMQARIQHWVDASVSKTVNCPEDMKYEDFVRVYDLAYSLGCKGCTTYRPSDVRGSILMDANKTENPPRPAALPGLTYKIKWPRRKSALYLTINFLNNKPHEMFITSKDARDAEWTTALTLMVTGILRKGGEIAFVAEELQQIESVYDGAHIDKRYYGSLPAYIGHILETHLKGQTEPTNAKGEIEATSPVGERCPNCNQPTLIKESACEKCTSCGYSKC